MPRHKLTEAERARGYQKLLRSSSKRAAGLKAYARKWLQEHGYSAAIVLLTLFLLAAPAMAQRSNVKYVDQYYSGGANPTVGQMATAAQNACNPDTAVPCYVIFDGILAVYPQGSLPTPCAQCIFVSYMTIGAVQVATNALPTFTTVWPTASPSFPLLGAAFNGCTAGSVPYSFAGNTSTGFGMRSTTTLEFCINGNRQWVIDNGAKLNGSRDAVLCFNATANDALGTSCDTGISRGTAVPGQLKVGNGAANDASGDIRAATETLTGALTVASCTGCGGGASIISSMMTGVCSPALTNTLVPLAFGGSGGAACVTSTTIVEIAVRAGTVQNMRVVAGTAGVNASSGAFTVFKNGVAQTLTCTVGTATSCNDTTHPFTTVAGDKISVRGSTQVAETLANVSITLEVN